VPLKICSIENGAKASNPEWFSPLANVLTVPLEECSRIELAPSLLNRLPVASRAKPNVAPEATVVLTLQG